MQVVASIERGEPLEGCAVVLVVAGRRKGIFYGLRLAPRAACEEGWCCTLVSRARAAREPGAMSGAAGLQSRDLRALWWRREFVLSGLHAVTAVVIEKGKARCAPHPGKR